MYNDYIYNDYIYYYIIYYIAKISIKIMCYLCDVNNRNTLK